MFAFPATGDELFYFIYFLNLRRHSATVTTMFSFPLHATLKDNPSCCTLRPRTTPSPEEKSMLGLMYGVLLWASINAATPLGARGCSVIDVERIKLKRSILHHPTGAALLIRRRIRKQKKKKEQLAKQSNSMNI